MKLFKRIMSVLLAGSLALGSFTYAFAAENTSDPTAVTTGGTTSAETEEQPEEQPEEYKPIDTTGYTRWTTKSGFSAKKNYYINSAVKVTKNKTFTLPKDSTLVLSKGANLMIYAGSKLNIKGSLIIEPGAKITVTGILNFYANSSGQNYGSIVSTKSGSLKLSSTLTNESVGTAVLAGSMNIYKAGNYINNGKTTFAEGCKTTVTGNITSTYDSQTFIKGKVSVTLSGSASFAGYLRLSGELVNSGILSFDKELDYKKMSGGRLAVSKSGRFSDKRHENPYQGTPIFPEVDSKTEYKGIDVSTWQDTIDWEKVKASGVDFAMVRATFSTNHVDNTFVYNVTEAKKAGVKVGVYHYSYAETVAEAKAEVKHLLETIAPYELDYPIAIDIEENSQKQLGTKKITAIAKTMLDAVRDAGYYPILYSNTNWLTTVFDMSQLSEYDVWVADWRGSVGYTGEYGIWQYSCQGKVSGIKPDVDLNISYKDYAKIIKEGGYNKVKKVDAAA